MGNEKIPEPFCWDKSFTTLYDIIDDEHKTLFIGIFNCNESRGDPGKLKELARVIDVHFRHEEKIMQNSGYNGYGDHKKKHDDFEKTLRGLSTPLSETDIHDCMQWLVNHIKQTDFMYKGQLTV